MEIQQRAVHIPVMHSSLSGSHLCGARAFGSVSKLQTSGRRSVPGKFWRKTYRRRNMKRSKSPGRIDLLRSRVLFALKYNFVTRLCTTPPYNSSCTSVAAAKNSTGRSSEQCPSFCFEVKRSLSQREGATVNALTFFRPRSSPPAPVKRLTTLMEKTVAYRNTCENEHVPSK